MNSSKDQNFALLATFIVILIFLMIVSSCSKKADERKYQETRSFQNQLEKSPNTWTEKEKDRYNDFMEWVEKQ